MSEGIGLHEVIAQIKAELFQEVPESPKAFFVEGVEIEVHVTAKRTAKGGLQISVLQFAGLEAGGSGEREKGHRVTLRLRPLMTYEEVRQQLDEQIRNAAAPALTKSAQ